MDRLVEVKVKPNTSETKIIEETRDSLKVAVEAKAECGDANRALVQFLSRHFNAEVRILRGLKSRRKTVKIIPRP